MKCPVDRSIGRRNRLERAASRLVEAGSMHRARKLATRKHPGGQPHLGVPQLIHELVEEERRLLLAQCVKLQRNTRIHTHAYAAAGQPTTR
jgi:hypothetical protein